MTCFDCLNFKETPDENDRKIAYIISCKAGKDKMMSFDFDPLDKYKCDTYKKRRKTKTKK